MSGFEVVGAVSAAIAFINTARTICEAAKDGGGLTTELKTISPQLALADGILASAKVRGNALQDAAVDKAVMAGLNICKERSKDLKEIFQKIGKTEDESLLEQALRASAQQSLVELRKSRGS
jgi:cob(I)alamin adenosyltransferase